MDWYSDVAKERAKRAIAPIWDVLGICSRQKSKSKMFSLLLNL
ncbi:hypothetical protein [Limnospira platensis]